jgi:hypothetical protein
VLPIDFAGKMLLDLGGRSCKGKPETFVPTAFLPEYTKQAGFLQIKTYTWMDSFFIQSKNSSGSCHAACFF